MSDEKSEMASESKSTNSSYSEERAISKAYVEELRSREVNAKQKLAEFEKSKNNEILAKENEYKLNLENRVSEVSEGFKKELMLTKLQVEAAKAGIIDLDGVKLGDFSKVSFDEKNNLVGSAELIDELKKNKPYLFKKTDKTTYEKEPPTSKSDTKTDVRSMSDSDYSKHKASILKHK